MDSNKEQIEKILQIARQRKKEHHAWLKKLRKKPPKDLDQQFQHTHEEVFSSFDCLQCANCCKTLGPKFTDKDIHRIARHLKLKPGIFTEEYLYLDEDGDYVLKTIPCPFLAEDHYCSIYEIRPKACREYPHTNSRDMKKYLNLTAKNMLVCPAAALIVEKMQQNL